ncbi:ABC transporter substrate-binding protein [Chloroflexota bacterium]
MKKKIVWLVAGVWMAAALLVISCAPAVIEEEEEKVTPPVIEEEVVVVPEEVVISETEANMVKWTGVKLDGTVVEKMVEKPKYGGTYVYSRSTQPTRFDDVPLGHPESWSINPTNEELLQKDWARGPAGTGEWTAAAGYVIPMGLMTGMLAESWELADTNTLVFHIRKGVHWQDKPPLNGRELTPDDVVFSLRRDFDPKHWLGTQNPRLIDMVNRENSIYISPTDNWAVVIKVIPGTAGPVYEAIGDTTHIIPRDVVEKYGDMNDWKNVVGTGPFILKDYVGASSLTYVRNPNYWRHDPIFPKNQLPYIDTLKALIIPDLSTQMAGMRTGKIDSICELRAVDAEPLLKSNPELERAISTGNRAPTIYMRVDKPELPWYDIKVRQALSMAIDRHKMLDLYYDGKAGLDYYPIPPIPEFMDMYVPIDQMPESISELYEYKPQKAKQLLTEAGYPQGFKAEVLVPSVPQEPIELLQIIKDYWSEIDVDLIIDVRDDSAVTSLKRGKYNHMLMESATMRNPFSMAWFRPGGFVNRSRVSDPKVTEAYLAIAEAYFDEPEKRQMMKDFVPYFYEQAWMIVLPTPDNYTLWQPWLKGFYGANEVSYLNYFRHPSYVWIDQELKNNR